MINSKCDNCNKDTQVGLVIKIAAINTKENGKKKAILGDKKKLCDECMTQHLKNQQ